MKTKYSISLSYVENLLNRCLCDVHDATESSGQDLISDHPQLMKIIKNGRKITAMSNNNNTNVTYILKLKDVIYRCRISKSKIYRDMLLGLFPKQVRMGSNCVGWLSYDIENWITSLN